MRVIRVVVVEDQTMLRDSLVAAINRELDMEVVASLADAADVLDLDAGREIDVALLDVCTENNSSGIIAARKLREARPQVNRSRAAGRARAQDLVSHLSGEEPQGDSGGAVHERRHGKAAHFRDAREDGL